jgi:hypothetical protein
VSSVRFTPCPPQLPLSKQRLLSKREFRRRIAEILVRARTVAIEYYCLTGRPLGVTGEIGECEAVRLLRLELAQVREAGFDAKEGRRRLQIKSRCIPVIAKTLSGQRIGSINTEKRWDAVLLVLLNHQFRPIAIYEASRAAVCRALAAPGSKARNVRGSLTVAKFKSIGRKRWPPGSDR